MPLIVLAVVPLAACSSGGASGVLISPLGGADGAAVVVGTPCMPDVEESATFTGFALQETTVEAVAAETSGAAVCIGYRFQGLVTCPYGQSADGGSPSSKGCETTDGRPVAGLVQPQCVNHRAADTVTWSCRCANVNGRTDDGGGYCACPRSTTCTQAVSDVAATASTISGAYCIPTSALASADTCSAECDPTKHPCD